MATAVNGDAANGSSEAVKPPAGIILPPVDTRNTIEVTAAYIVRNDGRTMFEDRIRERQANNPKFNFLMSTSDPYYPYYEWRKQEIAAGRGAQGGKPTDAHQAPAKEEPKGPPKPPDYQFSARMPRINQKDLDVLKMTALFVAKNGRGFMMTLAQREAGNPQFQFLIPNHTFHNFFQHLVDQYSTLLRAGGVDGEGGKLQEERVAELQRSVDDKYHVLARARQRADWAKHVEAEKAKKEEEEEQKKVEFARIDWNDFVVVETIVFTDADDQAALPPPTTLNDIEYASLEERKQASVGANFRIEEAMPFEDTSFNAYPAAQATFPAQPGQRSQPTHGPAPTPAHQPSAALPARTKSAQEEEEERAIRDREQQRARQHQAQAVAQGGGAPMKIRENYVPRAAQRAANRGQMALCPNCKQQIPMNELDEHMRIELLDPSWKEQKAKADARYAPNVAAPDVANNLKRFASQRTDLFDGVTGQATTEEEAARRKKAATGSPDANGSAAVQAHANQMQAVSVEEQIRAIHQKFAQKE